MKAFVRKSILKTMIEKEFKQIFREKKMWGLLFGMPMVMILIFGFAVNTDVKNIRMGVFDEDKTAMSRDIVRSFTGSKYFLYQVDLKSEKEIGPLLDSGDIEVLLRIERGLSKKVHGNKLAAVQILIDGANSNRTAVINAYVNEIISTLFFEKLMKTVQSRFVTRLLSDPTMMMKGNLPTFRISPGIELRERSFFNPTLESRNFFLPSVIVLLLSLVTILLTSMSIVKEREIGTIEQIIVSPIRPFEFMLGKTLPFAVIGFCDMFVVTLVTIFLFGVPFNGSILFLFLSGIIYIISSLAVGLYISTISRTQQQAMLSTFLYFFPAINFSGFIFPIYSMPVPIQVITYINPLRYFIHIVRSIFLKGTGFVYLWPDLLALMVIGSILMFLSTRRFIRRLE